MKRSKLDRKTDKVVAETLASENARLESEGSDLRMAEARCPKCGSPDIDLKHPGDITLKCWNCGNIYTWAESLAHMEATNG